MSNIKMGKSGALAVTTPAAARALMWQDVAEGRVERPDVDINNAPAEGTQVKLKHPLPAHGLESGVRGVVVHVYPDGAACEVEIFSVGGDTVGIFTIEASDLLLSIWRQNDL